MDTSNVFKPLIEHHAKELKRLEALEIIAIQDNDVETYLKASNQKAKILQINYKKLSEMMALHEKFLEDLVDQLTSVEVEGTNANDLVLSIGKIFQTLCVELIERLGEFTDYYGIATGVSDAIGKRFNSKNL